ncbi:microtubule-associated protein Jupiter-like isoform X3 [Aphis gossypii]|uniref:microtubule-associated protein Jupiter-like isoform X3 n=1 Tax=Aphis gossypii TaxID=80765 RepID=UPI002158DFEF|nr:microtubule-associated protein Jupiter-like isoform X3 [Aphis gossypii]
MTSTNFNVGIGDIRRNTSKVLKPPGGGSSDIFGTASCDEVNPHKRGTNQKNLQSSIILGGQTPKHSNGTVAANGNSDKPAKANDINVESQIANDNKVESKVVNNNNIELKVANDNYVESQIVKENIEKICVTPSNKAFNFESASTNKTNCQRWSYKKKDGNPVTGEGYEAPKATATPAQHVSAQSEPAPEQKKASRVPPGGYSSGLW